MPGAVGRGTVLAGKYEVERVLGEGGMGVVVAARHLQLGQKVALKFLLPEVAKDPETVQRFLREAQSASRIRSEHVARVLDVGTLETGTPFMVMEFLEGRDLSGVLVDRGALPPREAVDYVLQGMEAIAEAHAAGIVHRDLKPANLFLTRRADGTPFVKVLDFGLSKDVSADRTQQSLTRTSTGAMGSPLYMAPEQVRSAKSASYSSDVWSLGVMLYELLTNEAPFDGESIGALLAAIVADSPKPLRAANPRLPAALEVVVMKCLAKRPEARHADVAALAIALAPFASTAGRVSVDRIVGALAAGRASREPHTDPHLDLASAKARSMWNFSSSPEGAARARRSAFVLVGLLALGSAVAAAAFVASRDQGTVESSAASDADARPSSSIDSAPVAQPDPGAPRSGEPPLDPAVAPSTTALPSASAPVASASASAAPPRPSRPPRRSSPPKPPPPKPSIDDLLKQGRH